MKINKSSELLEWIKGRGGVSMLDMVMFCGSNYGWWTETLNVISELICNNQIEGDLWEGVIIWKVKN